MATRFDRARWRRHGQATFRLVRYADDFVVMIACTKAHAEHLKVDVARVPRARRTAAAALVHRDRRTRDPRAAAAGPHPRRLARGAARLFRHRRRVERTAEAVNGLFKKIKRVGHGYRNFANYRLRLLHCGVTWHTPAVTPIRGRPPRLTA
jgi:Transposase